MANQTLRTLAGVLFMTAIAWLMTVPAFAQEEETYAVYLDDELIPFENAPIEEEGTILVEFRTIFEHLGYQVGWDSEAGTAYGFKNDIHIEFPIGRAEAVVSGETRALPVQTKVVNGRTLIPLRFLSEESGYEVTWDAESKAVHIMSPQPSDRQLSLVSNITLNGLVQLVGQVDDRVTHIRLDISHSDTPDEKKNIILEPMRSQIDAILELENGPGIYTMKIYTTTSSERYGTYRLLDTLHVAYPEDADLIVVPDDDNPNLYSIRARLSPEAEDAMLQIKKLDREAFMKVSLDRIKQQGEIEEQVYLSFGSGVYQVNLFELNDGNQQIKTATWTHNGKAGIQLDADKTADSQIDLRGYVSPDMRWMWIQYANPERSLIRNAFVPIQDGKIDHHLYLNMGDGLYQITIGLTEQESPYNSEYTTYETHEIENTDKRNRYLLPSETVQSDAEAIVALTNELVKGLESDMERSTAIHDWVANHIAFDVESYLAGVDLDATAAAVLEVRSSDSMGFARLNAALHRAAGIPAKVVNGEVLIGEQWQIHSWNEIYVDNRWVVQDPTWNSGKLDPEAGTFTTRFTHEYFDPAGETFALDHKKDTDSTE